MKAKPRLFKISYKITLIVMIMMIIAVVMMVLLFTAIGAFNYLNTGSDLLYQNGSEAQAPVPIHESVLVSDELASFRNNIIVIVASSLLISFLVAILIINRIIGMPLAKLCEASNEIAAGNMNIKVPTGSNDEIGVLADSFAYLQKEVSALLDEVVNLAQTTASGHLYPHAVEDEFQNSFREVIASVNYIEQANQAKTNFLTKISHEIRTPMNAIMGMTELVLREDICESARNHAMVIKRSGDYMLSLINDLLDLSKIEIGKLELAPAQYELPSIIYDTVQLNISRIGSKPIEFVLELDESLPTLLYGDELRIKQILNNFLSNAIKYTSEGYVKLEVKSFNSGSDTMLQFIVEDSGQGIKPEDIKNLFSTYTRFNTESNRFVEGTGIGLTIADSLIKLMGGNIKVESEFGKGSIFTATIKQQPVDCQPIGFELAEQLCNFSFILDGENENIACDLMPYGRVLVVDDLEMNLYVVKELLASYQVSVDFATSGFEALDKVNSDMTFDIIFMDWMMPHMDGIETTKKMRDGGYTGTIIALTADAQVGNAEMFKSKGFNGFISKPIDLRRLNAIMTRYVREKHLLSTLNFSKADFSK